MYVDGGKLVFESREQLTCILDIIYHHFDQFGFEIHIRYGNNPSKIEYSLFHPQDYSRGRGSPSHSTTCKSH